METGNDVIYRPSNIFSLDGRITRTRYWCAFATLLGANWAMLFIVGQIVGGTNNEANGLLFLGLFVVLPSAWIAIATCVKRWHDLGKSGWFTLALLLPLINLMIMMYLGLAAGQTAPNKFGIQPASAANNKTYNTFAMLFALISIPFVYGGYDSLNKIEGPNAGQVIGAFLIPMLLLMPAIGFIARVIKQKTRNFINNSKQQAVKLYAETCQKLHDTKQQDNHNKVWTNQKLGDATYDRNMAVPDSHESISIMRQVNKLAAAAHQKLGDISCVGRGSRQKQASPVMKERINYERLTFLGTCVFIGLIAEVVFPDGGIKIFISLLPMSLYFIGSYFGGFPELKGIYEKAFSFKRYLKEFIIFPAIALPIAVVLGVGMWLFK